MPLYVYLKAPPTIINPKIEKKVRLTIPHETKRVRIKKSLLFRFLSLVMIVGGVGILGLVVVPLFYYQFILGPTIVKKEFIRPIAVASAQDNSQNTPDVDYTKASTWFPSAKPQSLINSSVSSYTISIPDLKIKDATVKIGSEDLSGSLVHYGGTGLPGEYGVAVVFGHSILPVFYDPKSYQAIFSTIPTLKNGAKIILNYDGIEYQYQVFDRSIVESDDVSVLEQHYDNSYIYLVSCYPPGTYYKRIVVKARVIKPN